MLIKKNCAYGFLIFFYCYLSSISGALYEIVKLFGPTNTILLILIKKKFEKLKFEIVRKQVKKKSKYFENFIKYRN